MPGLTLEDCRFCIRPEPERIALRTDNFYVLLSLGPIVEGYALVVTLDHIDCCAAIPSENLEEFELLVKAVQRAQRLVYGASIGYEHGRTGGCAQDARGEPHCHHAHFHCVPLGIDLTRVIGAEFSGQNLASWSQVQELYQISLDPYLLFWGNDAFCYFSAPSGVRRQYLRHLAADSVGTPELADWVAFQGREKIADAKTRLVPVIVQSYNDLRG